MVDEDEQPASETLDGAVQSIAEAYPAPESDDEQHEAEEEEEATSVANRPIAHDESPVPELAEAPEDIPETPTRVVPNKNKKKIIPQNEEEAEDDDEESNVPVRSRNRGSSGTSYFPVTFGSTNGGAIAIANSYSSGKGEYKLIYNNQNKISTFFIHEEAQHQAELQRTDQQQNQQNENHRSNKNVHPAKATNGYLPQHVRTLFVVK